MTPLTQTPSPTQTTSRHHARKRRSLDALVASYIRELAVAGREPGGPARRPATSS